MYIQENNQVFYVENSKKILLTDVRVDQFQTGRDESLSEFELLEINRFRNVEVGGRLGTDGRNIWYRGNPIPDVDLPSFKYFYGPQCEWGTDRNRIYCFYIEGKNAIKSLKSKSTFDFGFFDFHSITDSYSRMYARDRDRVLYFGRVVKNADPKRFKPITEETFDLKLSQYTHEFPSRNYYRSGTECYFMGSAISQSLPSAFVVTLKADLFYTLFCDASGFYYRLEKLPGSYQKIFDLIPAEIWERQSRLCQS